EDLRRVVRHETHRADPELLKDRCRGRVVAGVDRQAKLDIGIDRVEAAVLEAVRTDLVEEPDPPPLVIEIEEDPPVRGADQARVSCPVAASPAGAAAAAGGAQGPWSGSKRTTSWSTFRCLSTSPRRSNETTSWPPSTSPRSLPPSARRSPAARERSWNALPR